MIDNTLILQLPDEVVFKMIKVGTVWSETKLSLTVSELEVLVNIIDCQELVQESDHTAPFLVLKKILILIFGTSDCCPDIGIFVMNSLLFVLRTFNQSLSLGAAEIVKSWDVARAWVFTSIGVDE